jgi:hypothetical protein
MKGQAARQRIAAAREAERRRRLRRRIVAWTAFAAAVVVVTAGVLWAGLPGRATSRPHPDGRRSPAAAGPPWPRPDDTADRARTAGLSVAPMEGTARHFHVHLDVFVNGAAVPVPAGLGISASGREMAELHTHDTSGVLHIEAPTTGKRYVLGQLFTEWNVRLDAAHLGGLRADKGHALTAYVNGRKQAGDPANIPLTPHREIALVYGNPPPQVPASYAFPAGL